MFSRRKFIGASACALALGVPAFAQQPPRRVAWLSPTTAADSAIFFEEFRNGLREVGYVEGRDIDLQPYWGDDSAERMAGLIAEAIATKPNVIVAQGSMTLLARQATSDIPVVFGYSGSPIEAKLVESLSRPGGNLTGISYLTLELVGKRMELIKEVMPQSRNIAVIANPQHPGDQMERRASEAAASALGLDLKYFEARTIPQQTEALSAIQASRADAAMMFPVQNIISNRRAIAQWATQTKIPTVSGWAQFAEGGNLMSYGPNLLAASHRLATFVDRILKGAKPADLPVELPSRIELVVNLGAAKALGITVPQSVLIRADKVID